MHGMTCRVQYVERRPQGVLAHLEEELGRVRAVPGWMLDPFICGNMLIGAPRVSLDALAELKKLLCDLDCRASSLCGDSAATEENDAIENHTESEPVRNTTTHTPSTLTDKPSDLRSEPARDSHQLDRKNADRSQGRVRQ